MTRARRGVMLLHTLILVAVMAWLSSVMLRWSLTRHMAARNAVASTEGRALLTAAQSRVFTCLGSMGRPWSVAWPSKMGGTSTNPVLTCAQPDPPPPPPPKILGFAEAMAACMGPAPLQVGPDVNGNIRTFLYQTCYNPALNSPCRVTVCVAEPGAATCTLPPC